MIPITSKIKRVKSNVFPINQEVTKNADGTGGPISIAKKTKKQKEKNTKSGVSRYKK